MSALAIVAFFLALLAIILIHEFGHYLVARRFGFRVLEYRLPGRSPRGVALAQRYWAGVIFF